MDAGRSTDRQQARTAEILAQRLTPLALVWRKPSQWARVFGLARFFWTSCSRSLTGSKPSRGYSNPEGGRCRGVEASGKPDLSRWYVS